MRAVIEPANLDENILAAMQGEGNTLVCCKDLEKHFTESENKTPFLQQFMKKKHLMEEKITKFILKTVPKWIQYLQFSKNEIVLLVYPQYLIPLFLFMRDHSNTQCKQLIDVTAVDNPSRPLRFQVVYQLLSLQYNTRVRVKSYIDEITPVSSATDVFSCAAWWEREVWDMFGIFFSGHPDLRRILTDYGFQGHPLRKDFPLSGYVEVRYDDSEKRVITESIEMSQEFRYFDFATPWETLERTD